MSGWRTALSRDITGILRFLALNERRCVAAAGQLRALLAEIPPKDAGRFPAGDGVWIHEAAALPAKGICPGMTGAQDRRWDTPPGLPPEPDGLIVMRRGCLNCLLPESAASDGEIQRLLGPGFRPAIVAACAGDSFRMQEVIGTEPSEIAGYVLMEIPGKMPMPDGGVEPGARSGAGDGDGISDGGGDEGGGSDGGGDRDLLSRFLEPPRLTMPPLTAGTPHSGHAGRPGVRVAAKRDRTDLCFLHAAYKREEISAAESARPPDIRRQVSALLQDQIVVIAHVDGIAAGKANTNARGVFADQIGGVYVRPEFRNAGTGGTMVGFLAGLIAGSGRSAVLFVRPGNLPARKVYRNVGFAETGGYRVMYFDGGGSGR